MKQASAAMLAAVEAGLRRSLLPPRFPARRDVELAGKAAGAAFFDHFWLGSGRLCVAGARLDGDGAEALLDAVALRSLLRAAGGEASEPVLALIMAAHAWTAAGRRREADVVLAQFDLTERAVTIACCGEAGFTASTRMPALVPAARFPQADAPTGIRLGLAAETRLLLGAGWVAETLPAVEGGAEHLAEAAPAEGAAIAVLARHTQRRHGSETLLVANDPTQIPKLAAEVQRFAAANRVGDETIFKLNLALDELLTGVIGYAYGDGSAHEVHLRLEIDDGAFRAEIADDGRPFDPLSRPEDNLGLQVVRCMSRSVDYRRDRGWNVLSLSVDLD